MGIPKSLIKLQQIIGDMLFPPTERVRHVRSLSENQLQSLPRANSAQKAAGSGIFLYSDATVRCLVQAAKYDGSRQAARIMGRLLHEELLGLCADKRIITNRVTLVPVPLSSDRYRQRGFNQCHRIARSICDQQQDDHLVIKDALKKTSTTPPQTSLPKHKRKDNLRDCFQLKDAVSISNECVVVIDDVTTTGTTFRETKRALKDGNPEKVLAVAFAQ